jgi:endonuclease YncB( thermonuclease family)
MLTLLVTLAIPAGAIADSITGQAIEVLDGDTFEIRDSANTIQRVRLSQIDAPEKHQDFSQDSKRSLTELIQGKAVRVDIAGAGHHGGWIGKVWVDGLDVNLEQIKRGMGWVLTKQSPDPRYIDAEKDARMARRGIWSKDGAVSPWEYRNLEIRWRE